MSESESRRASAQAAADRRAQERRQHAEERALQWAGKLVARYAAAADAQEREAILRELDQAQLLDEDSALALYRIEPELSSAFIQRHLPPGRRAEDQRQPWQRLMEQALARDDRDLYFALYRRQASAEQWLRETSELVRDTQDSHALFGELQRRHPQRWRPEIGPHLVGLLQQRGEAVLPYVMLHVGDVWSTKRHGAYQELVDLARNREWWDLWCAVLRAGASAAEYDREVLGLAGDRATPEPQLLHRLLQLAGIGAPHGARPHRNKLLSEDTILALYERFPHLVRGPYRNQLDPTPRRPLTGVLELAIRQKDDELMELLAARLAVRADRTGGDELLQAAAYMARQLQAMARDGNALERRSAAVLKRIPAQAIGSERELLRRNALARLLFEQGHLACLHNTQDAAALLQAEERHVCALAVRALSADTAEAVLRTRENLEALLTCLDRQLPRSVIRASLRALDHGSDAVGQAARIVGWARGKLAAQDQRYSTEALLTLVGRQLHRFPDLCRNVERPMVYRKATA